MPVESRNVSPLMSTTRQSNWLPRSRRRRSSGSAAMSSSPESTTWRTRLSDSRVVELKGTVFKLNPQFSVDSEDPPCGPVADRRRRLPCTSGLDALHPPAFPEGRRQAEERLSPNTRCRVAHLLL